MRATRTFDTPEAPLFDPWRALAAAVMVDALRALRTGDPIRGLDAALWLSGPDFELWADVLNVDIEAGITVLTNGRWKEHTWKNFRR